MQKTGLIATAAVLALCWTGSAASQAAPATPPADQSGPAQPPSADPSEGGIPAEEDASAEAVGRLGSMTTLVGVAVALGLAVILSDDSDTTSPPETGGN